MSDTIYCTVETDEMARSLNRVSNDLSHTRHAVELTTGAVVSMKAAVIAAEKEGADHVVANVNRGFYSLIRSQISQKMARLQSDVDSHLMKLNQMRKSLSNIRSRMERDYNMISARYTKLFTGLNKNLEKRVWDLDRPVFKFAVNDMTQISNRTAQLGATVPLSQTESIAQSQRMSIAAVKHDGNRTIESIERFLHSMLELRLITGRIMLPRNIADASRPVAVPAVMMETNYDATGARDMRVWTPAAGLPPTAAGNISSTLYEYSDALPWQPAAPDTMVAAEFNRLVQQAGLSGRVADTMHALMSQSNPLSL